MKSSNVAVLGLIAAGVAGCMPAGFVPGGDMGGGAEAVETEALALAHRLSRSDGRLRYSTASAVFEHGDHRVVMPGFQPFAVYEVAVANVAPALERQPAPGTVDEVLSWAPYPLATAEIAELRGISLDQAQDELRQAGAKLSEAAGDGYWSSQ